ncbi:MAG: VOC family protein [Candidatus Promineofilum sp.]|nr:VOC family protein [Promineifilum sp.]MCW5864467.1 VOC family protein [Anaerolineae bacterium]
MITAVHTLIYSDDPDATRAFLRDVLGWPWVSSSDAEPEWLIFKTGPSELGVHPTGGMNHDGSAYQMPRKHEITLMCDDLAATMADLAARGATFAGEPMDQGFGLTVLLHVPGADDILLYEPRHRLAHTF